MLPYMFIRHISLYDSYVYLHAVGNMIVTPLLVMVGFRFDYVSWFTDPLRALGF